MTRTGSTHRKTLETDVQITIDLDGAGNVDVSTGVGFYDHMLTAFGHHGLFDLDIKTVGDLHVDEHHTVEDTALVLGEVIAAALGDRTGIRRYGSATIPMDEAVATAVVDIGGRPYAVVDLPFTTERLGSLGTQMIPHALEAFARTAGCTLNLKATGSNDHHIAEAAFKALAYAIRAAVEIDPRRTGLASTKGTT
jgi:imidazoleglycerol-phosphate dehydratase